MGSKIIWVSYVCFLFEEIKNVNFYIVGLLKSVKEYDFKILFFVYGIIILFKILIFESGESCGVGFIWFD